MGSMGIIPETAPIVLTSKNTSSNYLLIVDAYSKNYRTLWYGINYYRIGDE